MAAACAASTTIDGRSSSGPDPYAAWFAAQVWVGREQRCAAHLARVGYEVFLPLYRERRRWSDRVKRVDRALFAGYLFCRLSSATAVKAITVPGVIRIVGNEEGPLPVAADEMAAVRRIVDSQLDVETCEYPKSGEPVIVCHGPLRGTEGIVERTKGSSRLVVAITLLCRAVAVEIDAMHLRLRDDHGRGGAIATQR